MTVQSQIMRALKDAPRLGYSVDDLCVITGALRGTMKTTLGRLYREGLVWKISLSHMAVYFPTEEARDAAEKEVNAQHRRHWDDRHEAAAQRQKQRDDGRPRTGVRVSRGNRGTRESTADVVVAYLQRQAPNPMAMADMVRDIGRSYPALKQAVMRLLHQELIFAVTRHSFARYFASRTDRDRWEPILNKPRKAAKSKAKSKTYQIKRSENWAPKPRVAAVIVGMEEAQKRKIICPPCRLDRFAPTSPIVGGFYDEWVRLRGGKP